MTNTTIDESGRRTASVAVRGQGQHAMELQKRATWQKSIRTRRTNISIKSRERSYQYI